MNYFYAAPFSIIKNEHNYSVLTQLGGAHILDKNTLIELLGLLGKEDKTQTVGEVAVSMILNRAKNDYSSF
ncbi:hypothetical protein COT72_03185 [archaeon CG10_big_fil_rev_8_21_14_0_10_43_11]|nr:MAG: hypothetical protein COT72_03185 [archaeon CG10_big_fil_rev_8_21_14_0_10_43_11]